jgi:hypothetical protein
MPFIFRTTLVQRLRHYLLVAILIAALIALLR